MRRDSGRDRRGFTPRQLGLMELVARGFSNKEIASQLGISEQAVKEQISVLLLRRGVRNRAALADVGARAAIVGEAVTTSDWLPFLFQKAAISITFLRGPEHVIEAINEQGRRAAGQRDVIGVSFRAAYPNASPKIVALIDRVYSEGRARTLIALPNRLDRQGTGVDEVGVMTLLVQPVPALEPGTAGVLLFAIDVTDAER